MSVRRWIQFTRLATVAVAPLFGAGEVAAQQPEQPSSLPATQPAPAVFSAVDVPVVARRMVWDRVRVAAELTRRESQAQKDFAQAALRCAENPQDQSAAKALEQAQAALSQVQELKAKNEEANAPRVALESAAYLGVTTSPVPTVLSRQLKLADGCGLLVDYVEPGSPADVAGLEVYDVATRFDDQILINPQQLAVLVRGCDAGADVKLTVIREAKQTVLPVKLVQREVKPLQAVEFGNWFRVADTTPVATPLPTTRRAADPGGPIEFFTCSSGDLVRTTVSNLEGPGRQTVSTRRVSDQGQVTLPYLPAPVRATGLTESELEKVISQSYRDQAIVEDLTVEVEFVGKSGESKSPPNPRGE